MAKARKKSPGAEKSVLLTAALLTMAALGVVLYVRLRLLATPLVRDEGEFAYAGQLLRAGISPYLQACFTKLPGMALLNALFLSCFGGGVTAIRLGLLVANLLSGVLLFCIGRKLFGTAAGLLAATLFVLATLSHHLLGLFAHASHFVVLFTLAAVLCILGDGKPLSQYRYLTAGLFFGCAVLIGPVAIPFLLAGVVTVLFTAGPLRVAAGNVIILLFGTTLPVIVAVLQVLKQGAFVGFWFWTVRYAVQSAGSLAPLAGWSGFKGELASVATSMPGYWILGLLGLILLLVSRNRHELALMLPLLGAAILTLIASYDLSPQDVIPMMPAVALLAGGVVSGSRLSKTLKLLVVATLLVAASFQCWSERWFLFASTPQQYLKNVYRTPRPFVETVAVADYLTKHTKKNDVILVLGSEPQLYFYAGRPAASSQTSLQPLLAEHPYTAQLQQKFMQEISTSRPKYLVLVDEPTSWAAKSPKVTPFRARLDAFVSQEYALDGFIRLSREGDAQIVLNPEFAQSLPREGERITIYRAKK